MNDFRSFGEYRESDKKATITAITFLLVGVGIGAIAAIFMSPKSGKQMRKTVRRKYEDARDMASEWRGRASDAWENRSDWADAAKKKVEPMVKRMRRD